MTYNNTQTCTALLNRATALAKKSKNQRWAPILAKMEELPSATETRPFWRAHYLLLDLIRSLSRGSQMAYHSDVHRLLCDLDDARWRFEHGDTENFCVTYCTPNCRPYSNGGYDQRLKFFDTMEEARAFAEEMSHGRLPWGGRKYTYIQPVEWHTDSFEFDHICGDTLVWFCDGAEYVKYSEFCEAWQNRGCEA